MKVSRNIKYDTKSIVCKLEYNKFNFFHSLFLNNELFRAADGSPVLGQRTNTGSQMLFIDSSLNNGLSVHHGGN